MGEPIRILHRVVNMNRGGAETLIMNIYRNIDRERIQFDFLISNTGVFDDEIRSLGGRIYQIPYINKSGPFKYTRDVYRFFKEHNEYKIVHSHMDRMSGLIMREAKRAGVPVRIAHSHNTQSQGNLFVKAVKRYYSFWLKDATDCLACSQAAAKAMFPEKDVTVIKNGIDVNKFSFNEEIRDKIRRRYSISDKLVLGNVARFEVQKNHEFLIDIFSEVHEINKNSVLILVGKGRLEKDIQDKVRIYGLENAVIFMGSRQDVHELVQAFDVFVFPSLFEGLPVALLEAQAAGLRCVVSDTITKEADITGNVEFVSLKKSAGYWADLIVKCSDYERKNADGLIKGGEFDIVHTAELLANFYLSKMKNIC